MELNFKIEHPSIILKNELVIRRGYSVTEIALMLKTTRANMSNILNGKTLISPNMALRITAVFGGSAKHLLDIQNEYLLQQEKDVLKKQNLDLQLV